MSKPTTFKRDYRDILGGTILVVLGLWFSLHAIYSYELGTFRRMGPGMFPAGLGFTLAFFGALQVIPAFFRPGTMPALRFYSPLFVLSSVLGFAIVVGPFGLLPAIIVVTVISSMAELRVRPMSLALLCGVLCLLAWLTFRVALNLPLQLWNWPF